MFNKVMAASLAATMTLGLAGCGGNAATAEVPVDTTESDAVAEADTSAGEVTTTEAETLAEEEAGPVALTDADGNELYDQIVLESKAGFFMKIRSFFRNLFGSSRIVE